jgi:hypothetical protein
MIQCTQIDKYNIPHQQNEGQKPYDHLKNCRKGS